MTEQKPPTSSAFPADLLRRLRGENPPDPFPLTPPSPPHIPQSEKWPFLAIL